ncbi:hypothetical protein D3C76_1547930 [compost metagenome]
MAPGTLQTENFPGGNHHTLRQQAIEHPPHVHRAHGLEPEGGATLRFDDTKLLMGMFQQQPFHAAHAILQHGPQGDQVLLDTP